MLHTIIQKNSYQDSITLMLLTNEISAMKGIKKVSIMMGTPANKDILKNSGLGTPELAQAGANDIAIVMDIEDEKIIDAVLENMAAFLAKQGEKSGGDSQRTAKNWDQALELESNSNIALFSLPGQYAANEADIALEAGKNVMIFSDNVSLEDECELKKKAALKGLVVMGPDCGTTVVNGIPFAFSNVLSRGSVGIIGASGTGVQEISTLIVKSGVGISHVLGTGGRDLSEEVGAITMKTMISALENDTATECIVIVSKPPAKKVKDEVLELLRAVSKPVVVIFLGEENKEHEPGIYYADTLEEAAQIALLVAKKEDPCALAYAPKVAEFGKTEKGKTIKGLYAGGTLAGEAAILIKRALGVKSTAKEHDGYMLQHEGFEVVDLGDDAYTQGKPHPMIDPTTRMEFIRKAGDDPKTAVVLFDIVLGYGASDDMATALRPAIEDAMNKAKADGRQLHFIVNICGTELDPQGYSKQKEIMESYGVHVAESNASAVASALAHIGYSLDFSKKSMGKAKGGKAGMVPEVSEKVAQLLSRGPDVINVGLKSFTKAFEDTHAPFIQFDWKPVAGGDVELQKILTFLNNYGKDGKTLANYKNIDEANQAVIDGVLASVPMLKDVVPAKSVIPELEGKVLLHAGPPMKWEAMTSPMRGSCIGAVLFEGWAKDEKAALAMLEGGEVKFIPCHHVGAVGPMGGITSANMPVLVVENVTNGNKGYSTMNEGIGAVLRFGAYSQAVIDRLKWMRDVLAPTLSKILKEFPEGMNVNVLVTKSIAMGDEFHQRNIAGSLNFFKEVAPVLTRLEIPEDEKRSVMKFLADTDQFFLNIMMAAAKSVMDAARTVTQGTVVTAMTRNGENFGIRISGMGDEWFTGPVNTPDGLYFTGYSSADANPDMGDSAITETFGVGGMAMIAAPAVTRFVGSGGFEDALNTSNEMMEICIARNPGFPVPTWDFKGICLGIDARKVVATQITPVINTGIAHKKAGIGQIGAGTVHPPVLCFEKALRAYAKKLGYKG